MITNNNSGAANEIKELKAKMNSPGNVMKEIVEKIFNAYQVENYFDYDFYCIEFFTYIFFFFHQLYTSY